MSPFSGGEEARQPLPHGYFPTFVSQNSRGQPKEVRPLFVDSSAGAGGGAHRDMDWVIRASTGRCDAPFDRCNPVVAGRHQTYGYSLSAASMPVGRRLAMGTMARKLCAFSSREPSTIPSAEPSAFARP